MGYRQALTSATDVDTGAGNLGQPGVRLYQDLTASPQRGVAEWRTGQTHHTPATAVIDSIVSRGATVGRWKFTGPARDDSAAAAAFIWAYMQLGADLATWSSRLQLSADLVQLPGANFSPSGVTCGTVPVSSNPDYTTAPGNDPAVLANKGYVDSRFTRGAGSYTSTAAGDITIPHGLGALPTAAFISSRTPGAAGDTHKFAISSLTATNIVARVYYNGTAVVSAAIATYWLAVA